MLLGLTGRVSLRPRRRTHALGAYAVAVLTTAGRLELLACMGRWRAAGRRGGRRSRAARAACQGPYLAMITIAFSFIVQHAIIEMPAVTGGQNGIMGVPPLALGGLARDRWRWPPSPALILLAALGGRWRTACGAPPCAPSWTAKPPPNPSGWNPLVIKTVAFAVSAGLAGLAGGLFAPLSGFVTPDTFSFMQSILFVLVVIIGGAGTVAGPIAGAIIVGVLPELLATLESYRLLFFGGAAAGVVPVALAPEAHRRSGGPLVAGARPRPTGAPPPGRTKPRRSCPRAPAARCACGGWA